MADTLYVKGPLSLRVKGVLRRAGEELLEAVELAETEIQDLLNRGLVTTEKPTNVTPQNPSVTNPAALHPTQAYATGSANDPFAASTANQTVEDETNDEPSEAEKLAAQQQAEAEAAAKAQADADAAAAANQQPQPQIDPATGQPVIDPATGQPVMQPAQPSPNDVAGV